jgi:hypothetical protein
MPVVKLNVSLDAEVAKKLKKRANEKRIPASRYLAELIEADDKAALDALAEEGYRILGEDTRQFAEAAIQLAHEWLPPWDEGNAKSEQDAA